MNCCNGDMKYRNILIILGYEMFVVRFWMIEEKVFPAIMVPPECVLLISAQVALDVDRDLSQLGAQRIKAVGLMDENVAASKYGGTKSMYIETCLERPPFLTDHVFVADELVSQDSFHCIIIQIDSCRV